MKPGYITNIGTDSRLKDGKTPFLKALLGFAFLVQAALTLDGCFSPTFNEEVALASLSKPKLTYLHSVSSSRISIPISEMYYYPVPASNMGGFIGVQIEDYPKLYYLRGSSLKGPIEGNEKIDTLPGLDFVYGMVFGNYTSSPLLLLHFPALTDSSSGGSDLLVFSYDVTSSSLQGPSPMKHTLSDLSIPLYFSGVDPSITADDLHLLGLQLRASSAGTVVYIDTFILQKSTNRYYELSFRMDSAGAVVFDSNLIFARNPSSTYLEFQESPFSGSTVGRYFYSSISKKSYAQIYQEGSYRTFSWDEKGVLQELTLKGRISSVLSTGDLFCVSGRYGILYSAEGKRVFQFGLGTLSMVYELFPNGTPTLFFVEPVDQRDEGGQLFYETYTLPTADLSKLEE